MGIALAGNRIALKRGHVQQLLLAETFLKLAAGLVLVAAPGTAAAVLGLDRPGTGFWQRLLGAVLLGLAAATFIEERLPGSKGLGLAGCVAINLIAAFVVASALAMKAAAPTRRGKLCLWLLVTVLVALALVEIAYA